jgi:site-specific recombinase XerD
MDNQMSLHNMAFATLKSYVRGIRSLVLHFQKLPEACTVDEIKGYLVDVRDRQQLSSTTLNLRVCALKYYFRHVVHRLDLVVKIPNPRVQKYNTEILTPEELKHLRNCCRDMRQLLIISILYDTGIRVRELIRLRASDFDKHHRTIIIRNSKGNKTRVVNYGEQLRDTLNKYCKARGGVPANTLLESYKEKDKPLTLRGVQYIVRQVVKRSGIKKRISPHTLRHTFAVHYLNAGGSIFHLQMLLGHANITTTLHYLKYANLPEGKTLSVLDILLNLGQRKR